MDTYLSYLKLTPDYQGKKRSETLFWKYVQALRSFFEYLEVTNHPFAPLEPTSRLVDYQHIGKPPSQRYDRKRRPKYIPEAVLKQLDQHIEHLPPSQIPVIIVLRASGWRISDVLNLRLNTCLEQDSQGWFLCGDISKTGWLGHRIPLSEDVVRVIQAQQTWVRQNYTKDENPLEYLFPYVKNKGNTQRKGKNLHANSVNNALQRLAKKHQIVGEDGKIFHFHTHAFRHSKAVELINHGMSLVMVQHWMAHASPEMTLLYAQILDDTMRQQWQQTVERGAVRMNEGKPEFVLGRKLLNVLGDNALDVERIREHRTAVKLPIGNCVKNKKFICRFIELPCFHCAAYVLTPADLAALETYREELRQRIQIGLNAGNTHWVEANQLLLEQKVLPTIALLREGQIIAKTDKYEREYTNEEWKQRCEGECSE